MRIALVCRFFGKPISQLCVTSSRSVLLVVLLAACVGTPKVSGVAGTSPAPNTEWKPPSTSAETSFASPSPVPLPADLQTKLASLTLADVVDISLRNNPATQVSWANARAAADALGVAKGAYYPTVDLNVTGTRIVTVATQGRQAVTQNILTPGATLSWLLFDFGGRGGAIGEARNALIAADWTHNATIQNTVLQVESAFFDYVATRALLDAQKTAVQEALTNLQATQERQRVGLSTVADVLQAQTAYSQQLLNQQTTEGTLQTTRGALAASMGLPANLPYDVQPLSVLIPVGIVPDSVDSLISRAIQARPDLAAARADFEAAQQRVRQAKSTRLPSLALTGTGGRTYTNTLPNGGNNYQLQLGLNIPLFAGFSRLYNQREQQALADAAQASAASLQQQVVFQVYSSYYALQTASRRVRTSDDLVSSASLSQEATLARYRAGVGSILDLLTAQSALANARAQQIQTRLEWRTAVAQLAHDVGVLDTSGSSPLRIVPDSTPPDTTGAPPPK